MRHSKEQAWIFRLRAGFKSVAALRLNIFAFFNLLLADGSGPYFYLPKMESHLRGDFVLPDLAVDPQPQRQARRWPQGDRRDGVRADSRGALHKIRRMLGESAWNAGRYNEAAQLFDELTTGEYVDFLTLPAYEKLGSGSI